jgi:purine-nucleoside phosphorylase
MSGTHNNMENIREATGFLKNAGMEEPGIAIILGSGLSRLISLMEIDVKISYADIPHFPVSTVSFHQGEMIYGRMHGKKLMVMHGRFHYYEGYSMQELAFPVRVMKMMGVQNLLVSNACGSMNPAFLKGHLMMLTDHINLLGGNPLIGPNHDELGPRFPDMSEPYSHRLNEMMRQIAVEKGLLLHEGVYVAVPGPMLETRAEYRYLRRIGADVVGMSTVPEAIAAGHAGLPCAALSVITDECDPDNLAVADIRDILKMASLAEKDLLVLFSELIKRLQ